jgi:hypothetical protein
MRGFGLGICCCCLEMKSAVKEANSESEPCQRRAAARLAGRAQLSSSELGRRRRGGDGSRRGGGYGQTHCRACWHDPQLMAAAGGRQAGSG